MKKAISMVMSVIMIIMMMPLPVHAEEIPTATTGTLEYTITNNTVFGNEIIVGEVVGNDYAITENNMELPQNSFTRSVEVNATTSSVIQISVDFDNDGPGGNVIGEFEVPIFDVGTVQLVNIIINEDNILFELVEADVLDKSYSIHVENLDGTEAKDVFFNLNEADKQVAIFIPESSQYKLRIYESNSGVETLIPIEISQYSVKYDIDTQVLSSGIVLGGYKDSARGNAGELSLIITNYKGSLGVLDITTPDGTPYSGRVMMSSMYYFTNHDGSGSTHDAQAYEGKLPFPIQTDFIGLDYAYVVVSPTNTENTTYANTPFIDLTSSISIPQEGVYNLGSAQFQTPSFTGRVYESDQTTPTNDIHVSGVGFYNGNDYAFKSINLNGTIGFGEKSNEFYFASLGEGFTDNIDVYIEKYNSDFQSISATIDLTKLGSSFYSVATQIIVQTLDETGAPLPEGPGLDRSIITIVENETGREYKNSSFVTYSNVHLSGFSEGDEVQMSLYLDIGDFDHLRLHDSNNVNFVFTEKPGNYEAEDEIGNVIPYTVDENGIMHLELRANKAQLFGQVMMGNQFVDTNLNVSILDPITLEKIASSSIRNSGGYNGQEILNGLISIGHHTELVGEYIVSIEDPKNTIYYTGTELTMTFPLDQDVLIELPQSRAYGKVQLSDEDEVSFANNFLRVFVNIFNEDGMYMKNALVRNDGNFSAGELDDGRYFAKVYVSPFSPLASKYATSKMHIFELGANSSAVEFDVPLVQIIDQGTVSLPGNGPATEVWVNISNAQGTVVESIKTNNEGEFAIPMLKNGKYEVKALGNGMYFDSVSQVVEIKNGSVTGLSEMNLTTRQVEGYIVDNQNNPVEGMAFVYDLKKNLITTTQSNAMGLFELGGLSEGDYLVQIKPDGLTFDTSELVELSYTGTLKTITITLERPEYNGKVRILNGELIRSGWIHVYKNLKYVKSVEIKEDGSYAFGGVDSTDGFTILAESKNQLSEMMSIGASKTNDITMESTALVRGKLKIANELFSNGKFVIYDSNKEAVLQSRTDAFGEFTLSNLEEGTYYIAVIMGDLYYTAEILVDLESSDIGTIQLVEGE